MHLPPPQDAALPPPPEAGSLAAQHAVGYSPQSCHETHQPPEPARSGRGDRGSALQGCEGAHASATRHADGAWARIETSRRPQAHLDELKEELGVGHVVWAILGVKARRIQICEQTQSKQAVCTLWVHEQTKAAVVKGPQHHLHQPAHLPAPSPAAAPPPIRAHWCRAARARSNDLRLQKQASRARWRTRRCAGRCRLP